MKLKSSVLIGGKSEEHERHDNDFYPTPPECTHALMRFLNLPKDSVVWECACGKGDMAEVIKKYVSMVAVTDIKSDYGVGGVDFLTTEHNFADIVITNPPFDIAAEFIEKCYSLNLQLYAMFLKSVYWHSKGRLNLFRKTKPTYILPLTWRPVFAPLRGAAPTMDMLWTVWIKGEIETKYIPLGKPDMSNQLSLM